MSSHSLPLAYAHTRNTHLQLSSIQMNSASSVLLTHRRCAAFLRRTSCSNYLVVDSKKFCCSRFSSSDLNLAISSSIFRMSASKRSRMFENSVSMTLKSPNFMGMLRLFSSAIILDVSCTGEHYVYSLWVLEVFTPRDFLQLSTEPGDCDSLIGMFPSENCLFISHSHEQQSRDCA